MTHTQRYLRDGHTVEQLCADHGIDAKRHQQFPNLVGLKYNMLRARMAEPIPRECRGLVLDEADNWRCVARGFDKFFNHGEGHAATIDWTTARAFEKVDGTLCILYEYRGRFYVATTGTPDASGPCGSVFPTWETAPGVLMPAPKTFAEYFFAVAGDRVQNIACTDWCFMFELTGPLNRVVVQHQYPALTLLGARNRVTGQEAWPDSDICRATPIPPVRSYPLQSLGDALATFDTMSPLAQEGYVICDAAFNRIKVKHPGYIALHHAKDGMGPRAFLQIALAGETSEVESAFPEFAAPLADMRDRIAALETIVADDYESIKHIEGQKDFALRATTMVLPAALFCLRNGKASNVREFLRGMNPDRLLEKVAA